MAARFSDKHLAEASVLLEEVNRLRKRVAPLAHEDAAAYTGVLAAYALPDGPDTEERRQRIRSALSAAADVPLRIAEVGAEVAELGLRLAEYGNPNLRGDAVTAVLLADAAVRSTSVLVEINTRSAKFDDGRAERARQLAAATQDARPEL